MKKIFLLIFLSWLVFFILIPPLQLPDEPEHYENVFWVSRFIYPYQPKDKTKSRLFVDRLGWNKYYSQEEIANLQPITLQSYHPPLYYILLSPTMFISNYLNLDLLSRFYLTRIFSSFFYFGIIFLAYKILNLLFRNKTVVSSLLLFFSLNPMVIKMGVGINPDLGVSFFSYLLFYLVLKWSRKKILKIKQIIYLAIISSAAMLSKFSGFFTIIFVSIFLYIKNGFNRKTFFSSSVFYVLCFMFLLPWFILNFQRYQTISPSVFSFAEERKISPQSFVSAIFQAGYEFRHTIMHYSGFFGARNEIYPPKIFFVSYTILFSLFASNGFIKIIRKKPLLIIFYLFSLFFFLYILSFYFKKTGLSWDIQGRYLLPGFLPLSILIYYGIGKYYKLMPIFAILHYFYILFFIFLPSR